MLSELGDLIRLVSDMIYISAQPLQMHDSLKPILAIISSNTSKDENLTELLEDRS